MTSPTTTSTTRAVARGGAAQPASAGDRPDDGGALRRLAPLGGVALVAAPLLVLGGIATSPPQEDQSDAGYITSLAADPALTALSAGLFHYGFVLLVFGALAALSLVRGRRGRAVTTVGALATAFGSVQISGMLLSDWYLSAAGRQLPLADAVRLFEDVAADPWVATWLVSGEVLSVVGVLVLLAGLARAGVVPWWTAPPSLGGMVVPYVVPGPGGLLLGAVCWAGVVLAGWRLVRRGRRDVRAVEAVA